MGACWSCGVFIQQYTEGNFCYECRKKKAKESYEFEKTLVEAIKKIQPNSKAQVRPLDYWMKVKW